MFQIEILFILGGSVQFSHSVVSSSLQPNGLRHVSSLFIIISWSLLKPISIASVMPSNHLLSVIPFSSHLQYQLTSYQLAIRE